MIFLSFGGVLIIHADNGSLVINNSIINPATATQANAQQSLGYKVAPNLFLSDTTTAEKNDEQATQTTLVSARNQSFKVSQAKTAPELAIQKISASLFKSASTPMELTVSPTSDDSGGLSFPGWVLWAIGILVMGLATASGVFLGRKYARIFQVKQKKEG